MVLQGAVKASLVANSFCVCIYLCGNLVSGDHLCWRILPPSPRYWALPWWRLQSTNAPIIHGRVWHVQVAFSAHPNTNGGVHPIFCSFIHFMNLKVDSIDWLIDWRFACISEWLIEFNFDWLIYWILLLIDLLIDWLNWHLLIDLNWHLVTFVHLRLPSAQFTLFGSSQLIDWLLWGAALR